MCMCLCFVTAPVEVTGMAAFMRNICSLSLFYLNIINKPALESSGGYVFLISSCLLESLCKAEIRCAQILFS